jgi:L-fuconolactonase
MAASAPAAQWGRAIEPPDHEWLAKQAAEPILEPELPIIDPHHHFWDRPAERPRHCYLLDELLADINIGHNIEATVFLECRSMYRAGTARRFYRLDKGEHQQ